MTLGYTPYAFPPTPDRVLCEFISTPCVSRCRSSGRPNTTLTRTSITPATPTGERRQDGLNPMELLRLQGTLRARNLPLRFGTSLLFAPSEQETSMTTETYPSGLGPRPHWILCKSTTTVCISTTSMLEGMRRRSSPSTRKSRAQTRGLGC